MFASLSSFLPNALQLNQGALSPPVPSPPRSDSPPAVTIDPAPPRRKERKDRHANEAFIVVRPPPSKSTHPLSLQVQLVPPQSRHDRPVQALDTSDDTDLRRTQSNRSEASSCSGYASSASVSSLASTSTASSSRRMIIPLYNLNVHHVLPTTILDAGTDAKVAKFAKRGIEIIGLAFLEPIEVRTSAPLPGAVSIPGSARTSLDDSLGEFGTTARSARSPSRRPITPDRPTTSHSIMNSANDSRKPPLSLNLAPPDSPLPTSPQPQRSAKKLFTKMFKKKDTSAQLSIAVPSPGNPVTPTPSPFRTAVPVSRHANEPTASQVDTPQPSGVLPSAPLTSTTASSTAVLGVYPTLYPPTAHPKGRPTKYVWIVKKWLKGTDTGLLNGMMGKLSANGRDNYAHSAPHIEVRFEWSRGHKKGRGRRSQSDKTSNIRESHSVPRHPSTTNDSHTTPRTAAQMLTPDPNDYRSSIISQNSTGSETANSMESSTAHPPAEDSEDESDPEDSETPWTCSVNVQRLVPATAHPRGDRENSIRLKVATLSPTPHHPKVVGLLKMPFPLPDIEIERLAVRRRVVTSQGITRTVSNTGELVLTAEEIKDTVSSTALWLVVREAFGGVGRERKKARS